MAEDQNDMFAGDALPVDVLDHLEPEIAGRWPQTLCDLVAVIEAAHQRAGDDDNVARQRAVRAVRAVASYAGGRQIYVPQGRNLERALRDHRIYQQYDGRNVPELAQLHRLSEMQIYSILSEQRELHRRRVQPALF